MIGTLTDLLGLFDLRETHPGVFAAPRTSWPGDRVYGGQAAAQALLAASCTVDDRLAQSLQVAFLRPGDTKKPLTYEVTNLREGRTFSTRRVSTMQGDVVIMEALATFSVAIEGSDWQASLPDVPGPESLPRIEDQLGPYLDEITAWWTLPTVIDLRYVDPHPRIAMNSDAAPEPRIRIWFRLSDELPDQLRDDPVMGMCLLTYISDWTVLEPVRIATLGNPDSRKDYASLDHAMWFHRPVDFSDWLLYDQRSSNVSGGRGLASGAIYNRAGQLVCTVTQEGYLGRQG